MHTRWNRFTGSHPVNDCDPQNDDPDVTPEVIKADRDRDEQAEEDLEEYRIEKNYEQHW